MLEMQNCLDLSFRVKLCNDLMPRDLGLILTRKYLVYIPLSSVGDPVSQTCLPSGITAERKFDCVLECEKHYKKRVCQAGKGKIQAIYTHCTCLTFQHIHRSL